MPDIHPTAVVSPEAQLADDAVVGQYCTIEGKVTLGPRTRLIGHVYMKGPLLMGVGNTVYPFACIGYAPQHRRFDPKTTGGGIVIGNDNVFRESVTVHRAFTEKPTVIGDRNYFMVNSHAGHDCVVGNDCTLANQVLLAGHVQLGDGVTIGGNAGLHQHCRVGRLAMVAGMEPLKQDVPPFCVVHPFEGPQSLNLIALRRAGLRQHIKPLQLAFRILFHQGHTNPRAADIIEEQLGDDPLCREFAAFVRATKRGIARPLRVRINDHRPDDV